MSSIKVILRANKEKKDGTQPLAIRIIKDRNTKFMFLGVYIKPEDWDPINCKVKKSYRNSARVNNLILKKLTEADDLLLEAKSNNKDVTSANVKKTLKRDGKSVSFFTLADEREQDYLKLNKYNVAKADKSRISNFKAFLKGEDIAFTDITVPLLEKFKIDLASGKDRLGERSIMNHLLLIRTLFNKAIKDGIVDQKYYPFGRGKIKIRMPESMKIGLDEAEVKKIIEMDLPEGSSTFHARNKWLFSFYFAGMRISDVLLSKWSDFTDERLNYRMGKNQKVVSVKIPEKLNPILDYYKKEKTKNSDFIFPDMKTADLKDKKDVYKKLSTAVHNTNDGLSKIAKALKIEKKLSCHIARHTFGNIAGDKISPQMLQKLYRHSDIKTTMGYQANFIHKTADEALDSVINF